MARPLRIEYPGALYHITTRGNAQQEIYKNDADRKLFLLVFALTVEKYNWICHAYCLMDNHYHLLIETPDPNLSLGMRHLNGLYTQRFNRRYSRVGHIFQGRFKSILVDKESYLLELCRYIVLNPVVAGMVSHPEEYAWSSYRFTAKLLKQPEFLYTEWVLSQFSSKKKLSRNLYRKFVSDGLTKKPEKPWGKLVGQVILGKRSFVSRIQELLDEKKEVQEIPKNQRYLGRPALTDIFTAKEKKSRKKRNRAMHRAHFSYGYTLKEIGQHLNIHYSTVSRGISMK